MASSPLGGSTFPTRIMLTYRRDKADAEQAIATMNGEWLGSRAIRVNWANQKTQTGGGTGGGGGGSGGGGIGIGGGRIGGPPMGMGGSMGGSMGGMPPSSMSGGNLTPMSGMGSPPPPHPTYAPAPAMTYDTVATQTPEFNTTVYVGNLIPYTTQADLIPLFQGYGYIVEIRMQADRGFAFVKLDTHQNAALAITHLQNQLVHGRPIKCSWGKDKDTQGGTQPGPAAQGQYAMVSLVTYKAPLSDKSASGPGADGLRWVPWVLWWIRLRSDRRSRSTRPGGFRRGSRIITAGRWMGSSCSCGVSPDPRLGRVLQ